MPTRRHFLALSATALAGAALPKSLLAERLGGPVFSNASAGAYQQGLMTQATFEGLIGTEFKIFLEDYGVAWLRLREVNGRKLSTPEEKAKARATAGAVVVPAGTDLTLGRNPVQPVTFSLHFDVRGSSFPQDSYILDHGTLGFFVAFIVPGAYGGCSATFSSMPGDSSKLPGHRVVPVVPAPISPRLQDEAIGGQRTVVNVQ